MNRDYANSEFLVNGFISKRQQNKSILTFMRYKAHRSNLGKLTFGHAFPNQTNKSFCKL